MQRSRLQVRDSSPVQVKLVNILTYVPILSYKNGVTIP